MKKIVCFFIAFFFTLALRECTDRIMRGAGISPVAELAVGVIPVALLAVLVQDVGEVLVSVFL